MKRVKWTKEMCHKKALLYNNKKDFYKKYKNAYQSSLRHGWLNEVCSHMIETIKPKGYLTYEKCKEIINECIDRCDLLKKYPNVYRKIYSNKWHELLKCLKITKRENGYWNYENCKNEALKYNCRSDFKKYSNSAYNASNKNKWREDICLHMKPVGHMYKRLIYVYEFSDNYCYVGLTFNKEKRNTQHVLNSKKSPVYKHIKKTNIQPILKIISDYINVNDAINLEESTLNDYKKNNWNILNGAKTGGLGSCKIVFTKEICMLEAKKYQSIYDFRENSNKIYNAIIRNGWLDEICSQMKRKHIKSGYWNNKELCREEAKKYNKISHFIKGNFTAYEYSKKNNWFDEICKHMQKLKRDPYKDTELLEVAKKYKTKKDFKKFDSGAYSGAYRRGILNDICKHMIIKNP